MGCVVTDISSETTRSSAAPQTEVAGAYVSRLIDGAVAVSSVFQEKLRRALVGTGRSPTDGIDETAWRPVGEVVTTLSRIRTVAGPDVLRTTAAQMVGEECVETTDPQTAFATLDERAAQQVHRGPAADRVAACRARRVEDGRWRVATVESYRYPPAFAEGLFRSTAAFAVGVPRAAVEIERASPAADERHAVVVSW